MSSEPVALDRPTPQKISEAALLDRATHQKFLVNPYVRVTYCGSNEILVKHGSRSRFSHVIADEGHTKLLGRILRNLAEPTSVIDLEQRSVLRESEREDAARLVDFLVRQRVLITPNQYLPHAYLAMQFGGTAVEALQSQTVGLIGSGFLGSRIARDLARLKVKGLRLLDDRRVAAQDRDYFDLSPEAVEPGSSYVSLIQRTLEGYGYKGVQGIEADLQDPKALAELFGQSDFVVAALESPSPGAFHAANEAALSAGKPWMTVFVDGSEAVIGPIYVPGETLCYNEFEIQNEAASRLQVDYLIYQETLASEPLAARHLVLPPFLSLTSGWTTTAALSFLTSRKSFVVGRSIRVDFERFAVDHQDVLKLPRCPACAGQRPAYRHTFL